MGLNFETERFGGQSTGHRQAQANQQVVERNLPSNKHVAKGLHILGILNTFHIIRY